MSFCIRQILDWCNRGAAARRKRYDFGGRGFILFRTGFLGGAMKPSALPPWPRSWQGRLGEVVGLEVQRLGQLAVPEYTDAVGGFFRQALLLFKVSG